MKRALLILGGVIAAFAAWFFFKSYTPPILASHAVAELKNVEVGGDTQYLLIRGRERDNPILLFLHGGPGMPAMYLAWRFQRRLERDFVVVHWDQRMSGKSFRDDGNPADAMTSRLLADAEDVVLLLRREFGAEKIFLVAHSHGSYLGALLAARHPEWFHAYVGVGQVANEAATPALQDAFLRRALALADDADITPGNREDLLFKAHGELYGSDSYLPLVLTGLFAPEYSFRDAMNVAKGPKFYAKYYRRDVISGPLMENVISFDIPVYVFMGKHDMTSPYSLARTYFDRISAPAKRWVDFENSAHFPFFEEPRKFAAEMRSVKQAADAAAR